MQPAELAYQFKISGSSGTNYIDLAQCASAMNRRLYEQSKCYYVSRVSVAILGGGTCLLSTMPDNWVTSNAHTKAHGLWKSMQNRVLKDNPSVAGKWRDFKVYYDPAHRTAGVAANLTPIVGLPAAGVSVGLGEWNMSTLVLPEHDVDPATGVVLPADEFEVHMLGDDTLSGSTLVSGGIIKMYQDTRARQQAEPLVPGDMPTSWGTQLTDSGSQDPELAAIIDAENDLPPYDNANYIGGEGNAPTGIVQSSMFTTTTLVTDKDLGFKVPLGLIKVDHTSGGGDVLLTLHLTPGNYKGLMATAVKQ